MRKVGVDMYANAECADMEAVQKQCRNGEEEL